MQPIRYEMKEAFIDPPGYPDLDEFTMVELYTHVTRSEKRESVIKLFMPTGVPLIIATTAFGMDISCQCIARIGRAGRDGTDAETILYLGKM